MFKKIALATITAAALVAPSLVHAEIRSNGHNLNGIAVNGITLNGIAVNGITLNGVEPARREVYVVGEWAGGESSTVLTIELPRGHVAR